MEPQDQHSAFIPSSARARTFRIPGIQSIESLITHMNPGRRLIVGFFALLLVIASAGLLNQLMRSMMVATPAQGGSFSEGIVGTPRFINPLLANSNADRDAAMLVYSGLMRALPDGSLVPDLASEYTISDDGTVYTFVLRDNATFHDGEPVTAADVLFTITAAQNPDMKSVKRANWEGVLVETPDERTVQFTLAQAYAPFLENATIGILPEHLWGDIPADSFAFHQLNTRPVGSGPYRVSTVKTDSSGTPVEYQFRAFSNFVLGRANIDTISLKLYGSEEAQVAAYRAGDVDAIAGVTASLAKSITPRGTLQTVALPRVFAVFFNQNQAPLFLDADVREALNVALDKQAIIEKALSGFGVALSGPLPPLVLSSGIDSTIEDDGLTQEDRILAAREILEDAGWERNEETGIYEDDGAPLTFSLSTADSPELVATAEAVADTWRELGVSVEVKVFAASSINMNAIRSRTYDALLFGEVVGRTLDLFAFWHSSQRNDPGLNLALYTNSKADTLLSDARGEVDKRTREAAYAEFAELVHSDNPAVFLYAPDFLYYLPNKLEDVSLGVLTNASDRFSNVYKWHREVEYVWHMFTTNY